MNHITDNDLELFLLDNSMLEKEREEYIQTHISECSVCKANFEKMKKFYASIDANIDAYEIKDIRFSEKILDKSLSVNNTRLLKDHKRAVKVYDGIYEILEPVKGSLINRFVELVKFYPYRFTSSVAFVGLIITVILLFQKPEKKYINPSLAVIKDNVLIVYNEMGDILWKKGVPGMEDFRTDLPVENQIKQLGSRELLLGDLDNDGINELLIAGKHSGIGAFSRDTIYCFDPYGKLKWEYGCGSFTSLESKRWKHNGWFINDYFLVNTAIGKKLFVCASTNFAPTKIFELDFNTGSIKQEFYNSGGITSTTLFDVDKDGFDDIILGGINNAFSSAFVAVFNPDSVKGFSPSTEIFIPKLLQRNTALKYLLIPTTNYNKAVSLTDYNLVEEFLSSKEENTITAYVQEAPGGVPNIFGAVLYNFDMNWNVRGVVLADNFVANYNRLLAQGKVKEPLDTTYLNKLARDIRYLK
jgi:hypothetical protein